MTDEENLVQDTMEQTQKIIDLYGELWEKYKSLIAAIEKAFTHNPYIPCMYEGDRLRAIKKLESIAIETRDKTDVNILDILTAIEFLTKYGRRIEYTEKIIKTAASMTVAMIMPFFNAVDCLNKSFNAEIELLVNLYPEIKDMASEQLAEGKAADYVYEKLEQGENE